MGETMFGMLTHLRSKGNRVALRRSIHAVIMEGGSTGHRVVLLFAPVRLRLGCFVPECVSHFPVSIDMVFFNSSSLADKRQFSLYENLAETQSVQ
jgi:hypothetical protein